MAEGLEVVGRMTEISRAGVFVETDEFPRPGAVLAMQFRTEQGGLVDLRGEVRWSTQGLAQSGGPSGFGVVIHEPSISYREFFLWAQENVKAEEGDEDKPETDDSTEL